MRIKHLLKHFARFVFCGVAGWVLACPLSGQAATTNVDVSNAANALAFFPSAVTINVGDRVTWNWKGTGLHSTTDTSVWDSGLVSGTNNTFSFTFNAAGAYPYSCSLHAAFGMTGSVTVQSGNVPPSVSITSPTNGATFTAPWTGTIQAAVSDTDGTVSTVDFMAGTTLLGSVTNPLATASFAVTNLAAGDYTLTAVATDNSGASKTSAGVGIGIAVVMPVAILLSSPERVSRSAVRFTFSANPGLSYTVLRSGTLPVFSPISTNTAAGGSACAMSQQGLCCGCNQE